MSNSERDPNVLRVVTWNVRHGLGLDGRVELARLVRVLAPLHADVIAVQELDHARARSGRADQAQSLGDALGMNACRFVALEDPDGGAYGHGLLTRAVPEDTRALPLPTRPGREPRGAIWSRIAHHGRRVDVVAVHLGLGERERREQVRALLARVHERGSPERDRADVHPTRKRVPTVLAGDFNAGARQRSMRILLEEFRDAGRAGATWHARWPLRRLDYVLTQGEVATTHARTLRDGEAGIASDHLPLVVDLAIGDLAIGDGTVTLDQ